MPGLPRRSWPSKFWSSCGPGLLDVHLSPGPDPELRSGAWYPVSGRCFSARRGNPIVSRSVAPLGRWCHLVRIGEGLHDGLGLALAFKTMGRIFETVARASLSTFIKRRWHHRVDRYGPADPGRRKPPNQHPGSTFCGAQVAASVNRANILKTAVWKAHSDDVPADVGSVSTSGDWSGSS